jgi:hypothetical protein
MSSLSRYYHNIFKLTFVVILLCTSSAALPQEDESVILLRGARIIDGISDQPLNNRSLLIRGNTIEDILPANAAAPSGAEVINLNGKYIIPGLIEAHVHWLDWMGELFLNHGVTSVIAMDDIDDEKRTRSKTGNSRIPRLYHTAGTFSFPNDASVEEIRQRMQEYLSKGPDLARFPTYNDRTSRSFALAAKEMHETGYLIFGHAENAAESVAAGHDVIEHVWGFTQAAMTESELAAFKSGEYLTWATFMTGRWDQLDRMIEDAVAKGVYINPTLVFEWGGMSERAGQRELEEYRVVSNPDLVYYPDFSIPGGNLKESLLAKHRQIKNFSRRYGNTPYVRDLPEADRKQFEEGYQNVLEFIRRFVAAGGKIEAGTDTISGGVPGLVIHQEMQILVEAGLTPMQALKSATRWSAELLEGKDGALGPAEVGSIEPGKRADLVVLSDDPSRDILYTMQIERVMKNGHWIDLGYNPEYYTHTSPSRSIAGVTFAPVISSISPAIVDAGHPGTRVVLQGSGFQMISLVKLNGISVTTHFISPRRIEFELPANLVSRPTPNPYRAPGPAQDTGVIGYRSVEISVFNPPPEGGLSNFINLMVRPDWVEQD